MKKRHHSCGPVTKMAGLRAIPAIVPQVGLFTLIFMQHVVKSVQTDLECLMSFKQSISDPANNLQNWTSNITNDYDVCKWSGIYCSNGPVYQIQLSSFGLSGSFPNMSLCSVYLQLLDLSNNTFTGPIPDSLCTYLPYLVSLDLSHNTLAGNIPTNLSRCLYLNDLFLENNQLTGRIPGEIGQLTRLIHFDVANNQLSGEIPSNGVFISSNFTGNPGLCGAPLGRNCESYIPQNTWFANMISIPAFCLGILIGFVYVLFTIFFFWNKSRNSPLRKEFQEPEEYIRKYGLFRDTKAAPKLLTNRTNVRVTNFIQDGIHASPCRQIRT